jgi:chromosome segregation ATPase
LAKIESLSKLLAEALAWSGDKDLLESDATVGELREALAAKEKELAASAKQLARAKEELEELRLQSEEEMSDLKERSEEIGYELDESHDRGDALAESQNALEDRSELLAENLEWTELLASELVRKLDSQREQQHQKTVEVLRGARDEWIAEMAVLEGQNNDLAGKVASMRKQIKELTTANATQLKEDSTKLARLRSGLEVEAHIERSTTHTHTRACAGIREHTGARMRAHTGEPGYCE